MPRSTDADRENGDLILPAAAATADQHCIRRPMVEDNTDAHGTAVTVTVATAAPGWQLPTRREPAGLANPATRPEDLRRPRSGPRDSGVLARAGHTEAAVDLLHLAGHDPVGVIGDIVAPDGPIARGETLRAFATERFVS